MIDDVYRNSFKEVYVILENTDNELLSKIPAKFMNFIKANMNNEYETKIDLNVDINKHPLLKETEAILSLIYRSYWATNEEKKEFALKDKNEFIEKEKQKKEEFQGKDIYKLFDERRNISEITLDNNLMIIKKENFLEKFFKKIISIFKHQ